jgi:hypothetical protein
MAGSLAVRTKLIVGLLNQRFEQLLIPFKDGIGAIATAPVDAHGLS